MLRALTVPLRNFASGSKVFKPTSRHFSATSWLALKEIKERNEGDTLIFEGVNVKSPREGHVVKSDNEHGACPLCALDLDVKHTDILIIKQFMDHNAKLYPRKITGLCRWQQRKMEYLIEMATRAGLIKPLLPADQPVPAYQRGWRKFNTYFDESEIPPSKSEVRLQREREYQEAYKIAKSEWDAHEEMLRKRKETKRIQES